MPENDGFTKNGDNSYFSEANGGRQEEIIRFDNVGISYNGIPVVKDVSFSAFSGEILGIVGESGSGKSTLIKAAMGLLGDSGLVTKGDIYYKPGSHTDKNLKDTIDGKEDLGRINLTELTNRELRRLCGTEMGMIFQNAGSSFCPIRTVGKQLYEAMREHGRVSDQGFGRSISASEFRVRALELLEKLGFDDGDRILESYPFELSGGMQQRVGIAAAMLPGPKVLFADEPTSALDVSVQRQVVDEMLMVRKNFGTTIIIVTHNIGVIRAMADRVLVMKDGMIVECGDTLRVLNNPKEAYTKKLLAAVPVLRR
ncbi:MAG: ABC transporter ATP-binding protein [Butyrivibrio sp.]|nr:ABC transporter ATP-binding protein [Butyrivibrio sp.]